MAPSDEESNIQAIFSELKEGLAITLLAKAAEIWLNWDILKTEPDNLIIFEMLHRQAHTLSSTCSIFEYESISNFSSKIELALEQAQPRCLPYIEIEKLLEELEAAAGSEPPE